MNNLEHILKIYLLFFWNLNLTGNPVWHISGNPRFVCLRSIKEIMWPKGRQEGEDGGRWEGGTFAEGRVVDISNPQKLLDLASSSSSRIFSRLSKREMCAKSYERGDRSEYITRQINIVWVIKMFVSIAPLLQRRWRSRKSWHHLDLGSFSQ